MRKIISLCLLLAFVYSSTALPQEVAKGKIFVLDDFSGGLATKPSPTALPVKFGTICNNIALERELRSLNKRSEIFSYGTADTSEEITSLHRLYLKDGTKVLLCTHGDELEKGTDTTGAFTNILDLTTADYRWQWVTWHNLAIGCDGYNAPVKTDGTDATYLGTAFCEDAGSGAGPDGEYNYKVSFYTTSYEVIFDVASNNVTVVDNDIDLSMIPIGPDTFLGESVTGRKIYRSDDGGAGTYNLLSNGTIADNTTVILTDSDTDAVCDAEAAYPAGDATWTPPKGKLPVVHDNRLFFANDPTTATDTGPSTIYHSKDGSHNCFENTDYFNIRKNDGDEITFTKNLLGKLCIGKTGTIQYLNTDGTDPSADWSITDPISHIGCSTLYSATNTPLGIAYLRWDGLYIFNGQNSKLISDIITPTIKDISKTFFDEAWGEFADNVLYLAYASQEGGKNDRVLKYDIITKAYSIDIIDINCFEVFGSGSDWGDLYAGSSTDGEVYTYTESSTLKLSHSTFDDFAGTFDDMRYIPVVGGGNPQKAILELAWDVTIDGMSNEVLDKDSYQVLLLQGNGTDASTTITDYEGKTMTAVANAQLDTAQYKFGTASILLDGTGDYVTTPDVAAWDIGADDYTIEAWVRFNALPGDGTYMTLVSQYEAVTDYWQFTVLNTGGTYSLEFLFYGGAADQTVTVDSTGLSADTWYQLAMDKDGNDYYFFQDGVLQGAKQTNANSVDAVAGVLEIGGYNGANNEFNGWIDELRVSDGYARHIAAYTPPAAQYAIIDEVVGNIDRPDTGGTYISTVMYMPGVSAYNTLYWNETLSSSATTDDYFQLRGNTTSALCEAAAWDATQYTTPSGSDISGEIGGTAYEYTQYRITMSTDDIDYTPYVEYEYGFTVKMSYDLIAADMESSIDLDWESGYTDFGIKGYKKTLRKIYVFHEGSSGDLVLTFTTFDNISDTFTIDLAVDQYFYSEYFTEGALTGEKFKLNITHNDISDLKIREIWVIYDVEPLI